MSRVLVQVALAGSNIKNGCKAPPISSGHVAFIEGEILHNIGTERGKESKKVGAVIYRHLIYKYHILVGGTAPYIETGSSFSNRLHTR
jgi:hypothetical protein